jgi:hypothetical protein
MPTLQPSADVCSSGGGGGTDFLVAGPIRGDGNYDATVGDGSTVDSFALVGARDGNTIVKQAPADYGANAQADANWHIDGVGVADTALLVGVISATIADTGLESQASGPSAFFMSSTDNNTNPTVIIRKNGVHSDCPQLSVQDETGAYYVRAQLEKGIVLKVRQRGTDADDLFGVTDSADDYLFGVGSTGSLKVLDESALTGGGVTGVAALSGGTKTVSTTNVQADSKIFLTYASSGFTNAGMLRVGTIVAGTSFVINSSNGSDANHVNWFILNHG